MSSHQNYIIKWIDEISNTMNYFNQSLQETREKKIERYHSDILLHGTQQGLSNLTEYKANGKYNLNFSS